MAETTRKLAASTRCQFFFVASTTASMVHSLSSGKVNMFLCAACHAFTPHVNVWKNLTGIVVQIQAITQESLC